MINFIVFIEVSLSTILIEILKEDEFVKNSSMHMVCPKRFLIFLKILVCRSSMGKYLITIHLIPKMLAHEETSKFENHLMNIIACPL